MEPDGTIATHADLGTLGHWWNEVVVDDRGNVYVDSMGFDFMAFLGGQGQPAPGLVALVAPDGEVRQVADGIEFGNGMVLSPDGRTLVVAESMGGRLTAFDVSDDGSLAGRRTWADEVGPDGICMDADGAIWTSLGMGKDTTVRVTEGGEVLERIPHDRSPFACMLGGDDGRTLFVLVATFTPDDLHGGGRTGQVLALPAPSPHVGRP